MHAKPPLRAKSATQGMEPACCVQLHKREGYSHPFTRFPMAGGKHSMCCAGKRLCSAHDCGPLSALASLLTLTLQVEPFMIWRGLVEHL